MVREYMARKREQKPFVRISVKILVILVRKKKRVLSEDGLQLVKVVDQR